MSCPKCNLKIRRRKARGHYEDIHSKESTEKSRKKRHHSEIDGNVTLLNRLRGNVPADMLISTMKNMNAQVYQVDGYPMLLQPETVPYLQSILSDGHVISEIDARDNNEIPAQNTDVTSRRFLEKHAELSENDIVAIESASPEGLERLMGAVIVTGQDRFRITCAEVYFRDFSVDPHSESQSIVPSSVPTEEPSTQYPGDLKITHIPDNFKNWKMVIGVQTANYLITSGFNNKNALVGPGRCATFPVNDSTRIYIRKKRQRLSMFENDVLGLAQLRSNFGHPTTYALRRVALRGYGTLSDMPVTIFTLSQLGVRFSKIFRNLAKRSNGQDHGKTSEIVLMLSDIESPEPEEQSANANTTRQIISLFPKDDEKLIVTGNVDLENALTALANNFSSTVSDRNLTITRRLNNRNIPDMLNL